MASKQFRTHTCSQCCVSWEEELKLSPSTPNISGEPTPYCPFCHKRANYSTPVYLVSATGLTQIRVNAITFKLTRLRETREWCVRVYFNINPERRQHIPERDYYTTDYDDALGTMKAMAREELSKLVKVIRDASTRDILH